jgi:hypothetical protein
LLPAERLLKRADEPLQLGGRALDILIALVERAGEVVTRRSGDHTDVLACLGDVLDQRPCSLG